MPSNQMFTPSNCVVTIDSRLCWSDGLGAGLGGCLVPLGELGMKRGFYDQAGLICNN